MPFLPKLHFMSKQNPWGMGPDLGGKIKSTNSSNQEQKVQHDIGLVQACIGQIDTLASRRRKLQNTSHLSHLLKPTYTNIANKLHSSLQAKITSLSPLKPPCAQNLHFCPKHGQFCKSQATIKSTRAFWKLIIQTPSIHHTKAIQAHVSRL